jgi:hypothetical protein
LGLPPLHGHAERQDPQPPGRKTSGGKKIQELAIPTNTFYLLKQQTEVQFVVFAHLLATARARRAPTAVVARAAVKARRAPTAGGGGGTRCGERGSR